MTTTPPKRELFPRQATATFRDILALPELAHMLPLFQRGHLHQDFRPFQTLALPNLNVPWASRAFPTAFMDTVDALLTRWLALHESSRLLRLCRAIPPMHAIVFVHCVYRGHVDLCAFVHAALGFPPDQLPLKDIAVCGNQMPCLVWLDSVEFPVEVALRGVTWCAQLGGLEMLQYILAHRYCVCPPPETLDVAATNGHLDIVRWLHTHGAQCTMYALANALQGHHFNVTRFLVVNRTEGCTAAMLLEWIVGQGDVDIAHFLHEYYPVLQWTASQMDDVAARGHLALLTWLHDTSDAGCTTLAMDAAAGNGHLDVVQFLHTRRTEGCSANAIKNAAGHGHLEVVHFLLQHQTTQAGDTSEALKRAAAAGHVQVVAALIAHCHPNACTKEVLIHAAAAGHINVVDILLTSETDAVVAMLAAAKTQQRAVVHLIADRCGRNVVAEAIKKGGRGLSRSALDCIVSCDPHVAT
ncbi:Aste57867_24008 [Aphanomyces stellatus]|uniref:Aste57867_24008 protein n=1 Tax=Aphanomyces stellatus TaxID=120398 RepID=A0A485LQW1_9STRA|nr:hypothetical protein As57867_023935 [Aphanomyces stellatus]VFU00651.1 Aste57867_24008 [Aphanomyces stellatus]